MKKLFLLLLIIFCTTVLGQEVINDTINLKKELSSKVQEDITATKPNEKDNYESIADVPPFDLDENLDGDRDGILNGEDFCITIAGPKENNGCPIFDEDEDGIEDEDDMCPFMNAQTGQYYGTEGVGCPKKIEGWDKIITNPENPATFKGNWDEYLAETLEYPDDNNGCIEGIVIVKFIVDVLGNVRDVKAITGPIELRKEAERAVKLSNGKWEPAMDQGQKVRAYSSAKVTFKLD